MTNSSKDACPNCGYNDKIKDFAVWAAKVRWDNLPWFVRLFKRRPSICDHEFIEIQEAEIEKGAKRWRRKVEWTRLHCPKCGIYGGVRENVKFSSWWETGEYGFPR